MIALMTVLGIVAALAVAFECTEVGAGCFLTIFALALIH